MPDHLKLLKALGELNRVCRDGGQLIIPTYMNKDRKGKASSFAAAVGKAGADFKRQFTLDCSGNMSARHASRRGFRVRR